MGNKASTRKAVIDHLVVFVNKVVVETGSIISGKVYLTGHYTGGFNAVTITVRLAGVEHTVLDYGDEAPSIYYGTNILLESELEIALVNMNTGGLCEFPFSFVIPESVPSSYSDSKYSVEYTLKAKMSLPGITSKEVIVQVVRGTVRTPVFFYAPVSSSPIKAFSVVTRGTITVAAALRVEDGSMYLRSAVINRSSAAIKAVSVKLCETQGVCARDEKNRQLVQWMRTRLFKRRLAPQEVNITALPVSATTECDVETLYQMLSSGTNEVLVTYDNVRRLNHRLRKYKGPQESYESDLLKLFHSFHIKVHTAFGLNNLKTSCPYLVLPQPLPTDPEGRNLSACESHSSMCALLSHAVGNMRHLALPLQNTTKAELALAAGTTDSVQPTAKDAHSPTDHNVLSTQQSVDDLIVALQTGLSPCAAICNWVNAGNAAESIEPAHYFSIFLSVKQALDQLRVADLLATLLTHVSCIILAEVAKACRYECKFVVVQKLLRIGPVLDVQENWSLLASQFTDIEQCALRDCVL